MTPPRLGYSNGKLYGSNVCWNDPWPCQNGDDGGMSVPSGVLGVVEHTMDGSYAGTVSWFNNSAAEASAHFAVANDGSIWQFGPVNGWMSWHAENANPNWYGIEHEDDEDPSIPLTDAQMNSSAQLVEALSRPSVGNFSLQVSNDTGTEGYGYHSMGGVAWGDHPDCPGSIRAAQRAQIISIAQAIRGGGPTPPPAVQNWVCQGEDSLSNLAAGALHSTPATVLRMTAENAPGQAFSPALAAYINSVFAADAEKVPAGIHLLLDSWFVTTGHQTLQGIGLGRKYTPATILRQTAEGSAGGEFEADLFTYVNAVFARSGTVVPKGITLYY